MSIATSLDATGISDVMVIVDAGELNVSASATVVPEQIRRHFVTSSYSRDGALLEMLNA